MESTAKEYVHHGRNVKYFRELLGLKQEGLAYELGNGWSQKRVSLVEQKEVIEDAELEQLAKALKMPVEAIKDFEKTQQFIIFRIITRAQL